MTKNLRKIGRKLKTRVQPKNIFISKILNFCLPKQNTCVSLPFKYGFFYPFLLHIQIIRGNTIQNFKYISFIKT